ncbi:MAG: hypothetical protein HY874_12225, partial [Chloroflexi bacterium]|nr:hypothetical protein [Chloroflexota bacterium]
VQDVSSLSEARDVLSGNAPEGIVASLVVQSGQVQAGDTITVHVVLEASKPGIGAFTMDLYHDPNLLTAVSCDSNPAGLCNAQFEQRVSRFTFSTATPLVGAIEVGSVTFQTAVGAKGPSSLDAIVLTLSDPYGRDLQAGQIRNGVIEVIPRGNPD